MAWEHRTNYSTHFNQLQPELCAVDTGVGATSRKQLQQLYRRYFEQHDETKLGALVYWPGVRERERDSFFRSLRFDFKYRLLTVEISPLDPHIASEYSLDGIVFRPALPPMCRLVARYQGNGDPANLSSSYLVGVKNGRYYIDLAVPVRNSRNPLP
jgi:hypothetical protein